MTTPSLNQRLDRVFEVIRDRQEQYGDADRNFADIAAIWTVLLSRYSGEDVYVTAEAVKACMRALKEVRLSGNPEHDDSRIDLACYALL